MKDGKLEKNTKEKNGRYGEEYGGMMGRKKWLKKTWRKKEGLKGGGRRWLGVEEGKKEGRKEGRKEGKRGGWGWRNEG